MVSDEKSKGLRARKLRIIQVILTLFSNASKFSPDGSEITVDITQTPEGAQISITDQGIGISKEDIGKLFKPFPDIVLKVPGKGTGLGLSICKGIVELHGVKIWV